MSYVIPFLNVILFLLLAPLFDGLARPLLQPVRRMLPALGGVDLSPLVVLVLCEVALIVLGYLQPALWLR